VKQAIEDAPDPLFLVYATVLVRHIGGGILPPEVEAGLRARIMAMASEGQSDGPTS